MARLQVCRMVIWRQASRDFLSYLKKREDAPNLQKDGKPAGRLLMLNLSAMLYA